MNFNKKIETISPSRAPYLFAILVAINVACYTVCSIMMVKIIEPGMVSVVSLALMTLMTVLGVYGGNKICKSNKPAGVLFGIFFIFAGITIFLLDLLEVVKVPGFEVPSSFTGDYIFFTSTYMISDIMSEVFGYKASRTSAITAAVMAGITALAGKLLIGIPSPEWAASNQSAFEFVFGGAIFATIAGVVIFNIADWINDRVFQKLRSRKNANSSYSSFAFRALVSSACGKALDLTLFSLIVFVPFSNEKFCSLFGIVPWGFGPMQLLGNFLIGIAMQMTIEVALSPVTYSLARKVKGHILRNSPKQSLNR